MSERKNVMISSTARDLPEHRKEVMDACLRQGMFPDMMEHLPASDVDAIRISLEMVEHADIYLGIFAHRYGYVPKEGNPKQISITEMEYGRAVERGIPRLIFIMHDDHLLKAQDVETGEGTEKLKKLKEQISTERVCGFFKSPDDLRGLVIQALTPYRKVDITQFHYVSDIPTPPDAYIAHQYSLLQTHKLIGRQHELNILTDWVTAGKSGQPSIHTDVRIMNIVAIGGMGKSALTWKWFNDIAPQKMKPLSGQVWWSFYESDASFENFVIRVLAYVTRQSREEVQKISPLDREAQLLAVLDREPFLLVLDGLERIFLAYARMDAARLADEDIDQLIAYIPHTYGKSESVAQSFVDQHLLRKTADPRAGVFLRKLANVRASRILVSTRLYPADLQMMTGEPMHSCFAVFLNGLNDDDALNLWRAFKVSGSRETLLPMFNKFENHPLLIQSLASEVSNYRHAPGDFEHWQGDHSDFNPFNLSLVNARVHVLEYALRGLDDKARKVLETIAAFRMPASYDTLAALFVGEYKLFPTERGLDVTLKELEDRGLLGWDKRANRYDLHPIVRGVVWNVLSDDTRNGVFSSLRVHFDSLAKIDWRKVNNLEDLTPAIELYNSLVGLRLYDEALRLFFRYIHDATRFRLGAGRQRTELLAMLFPDGLEHLPRLISLEKQANALKALAAAYWDSGQLRYAALLYERSIDSVLIHHKAKDIGFGMRNLASVLRQSGVLRKSEFINRQVLLMNQDDSNRIEEAVSLNRLGFTLAVRNAAAPAVIAIQRSKQIFVSRQNIQSEGICSAFLAQLALWQQNIPVAAAFADRAWKLAYDWQHGRDSLRAARLQGTIALYLGNQQAADERLHYTLVRARTENRIEEELPALIALAELRQWQGNLPAARELLDDVWESADRGPYPLFQADAFNILAQIERDAGNKMDAVEAATKAYRFAWCDGEPFAYHWGLIAARKHLHELGAPEPEMLAFDESKHEPMPEIEINPKDEFWVDPDKGFDMDDLSKK
jgi:hypothetical protein